DLDHDAAKAGFVGAAGDTVNPAVVAAIRLAGICVVGRVAAIEADVGKAEWAPIGGAGAAGAVAADIPRVAGLRLERGGADRTGVAHAVAASISRAASGRRSLPEIRRGRRVSRKVDSVIARRLFSSMLP